MIAELHNKISSNSSLNYERSEDELTGNLFGTLRYMPFNKGLKKIICKSVFPQSIAEYIGKVDEEQWEGHIKFWPRYPEYEENNRQTEFDIVIDFDEVCIGIEVKYLSPLSSDDDIDEISQNNEKSCNQIAREKRLLNKIGKGKDRVLLLLANQVECKDVYEDVINRINLEGINFGYISWQKVMDSLNELENLNPFEQVMIDDLKELLKRKGFEQFKNFNVENEVYSECWEFGEKFDYNTKNIIIKDGYYGFR